MPMKTQTGLEIIKQINLWEQMGYGIGSQIHHYLEKELDGKILVDEAELREELKSLRKPLTRKGVDVGRIIEIKEILGEEDED